MSRPPVRPARSLGLLAVSVLVASVAPACSTGGGITASDPAVGANPGDSAALYVELLSEGRSDELVSARCDCARRSSLHLTEDRDGILIMAETGSIELPQGKATTLLPGGPHVMLEDLEAPLTAGSTVEVTLGFEHSADVVLEVPVVGLEDLAERVERPREDGA